MEPTVLRDLFFFRIIGGLLTRWSLQRLGCNAELIVDEFAEKLLEELDYVQEARNIEVGQGEKGRDSSYRGWRVLAGALEGGGSSLFLCTQLRSPYLRTQTPTHTLRTFTATSKATRW